MIVDFGDMITCLAGVFCLVADLNVCGLCGPRYIWSGLVPAFELCGRGIPVLLVLLGCLVTTVRLSLLFLCVVLSGNLCSSCLAFAEVFGKALLDSVQVMFGDIFLILSRWTVFFLPVGTCRIV